MAWTDPRTWVAAEVLTAALFNTHVRDNLRDLRMIKAIQDADLTKNNNTTFANLSGMSFAVGANEDWLFMAALFVVSAAVADAKYTLTGPAGATVQFGLLGPSGLVTQAMETTAGNAVNAHTTGGTSDLLLMTGIVRTAAAAGTVQLQAAQNSADASNSIFWSNSFLIAFREGG